MRKLFLIFLCTVTCTVFFVCVKTTGSQSAVNRSAGAIRSPNSNRSATNVSIRGNANAAFDPSAPGKVRILDLNGTRLDLLYIPEGSFMMGSGEYSDEKPLHRVDIRFGFYIGRYEVTQSQWVAVMGNNPSRFRGNTLPVENVSWDDTQQFIDRLNQGRNDGLNFRLPSEAEWEYAARAGSDHESAGNLSLSRVPGGTPPSSSYSLDSIAWYGNNSMMQTHPVGSKQPNAFGVFDMLGNVWEWCDDWYDSNYYVNSPRIDPEGPNNGSEKVLRGGSWVENANGSRLAGRSSRLRNSRDNGFIGFRIAASIDR